MSIPAADSLEQIYGVGYRQRMARLYAQFITPDDLTFDIGANLGSRTNVFSDLGARVIAVEPLQECVRALYVQFHDNPRVTIVPRAVGSTEGHVEIQVSPVWNLSSSLNPAFPEQMSQDPTFQNIEWTESRMVAVTTLDQLIAQFGLPAFTKIDVEGFEAEVLKGLSQPLPALSFEFIPHFSDPAFASIARLEQLAPMQYNYAMMEQMRLVQDEWVNADEIRKILKSYETEKESLYGDVYARVVE